MRRRSVTILAIIMVLAGGVFTYGRLPVELFPQIEFPLVTVSTFYPSANPDAVVRDVTAPIERAISGVDGISDIQSTSRENLSLVLANFEFGTDMAEAERTISSNLNSISFPSGVQEPRVGRIDSEAFSVIQLSVLGERDVAELQVLVDSVILPSILGVDGVFSVVLTGDVSRQVVVTVDAQKASDLGISPFQLASALRDNNVALPAGTISSDGISFPVRTTHLFTSVEQIRGLMVGASAEGAPVRLSEVADVAITTGVSSSISRTNGKPSIGLGVLKEPDANTIDVTRGVLERINRLAGLPPDVEIVTISNDGPEIQAQVDSLQREAVLGFIFAVAVVFMFLLTLRPGLVKGVGLTLRPTLVIGLSIPLSIFTGILLMGMQGMTLNLMTLGGLAISVGRVVDDSIVVLENVYRHIQRGQDRIQVALEATREVAPAITASTLTTIVVFVPLAFIQGLVGSFFLPFALTVSFALVASLFVALTAVPVLGAILLRPGDMTGEASDAEAGAERDTWMQRAYTPALAWALHHKIATLAIGVAVTVGSLGLVAIIPVTLFPSSGERFLVLQVTLPSGTSPERELAEVRAVEDALAEKDDSVDLYQTTIGTPADPFAPGGAGAFASAASIFVRLKDGAPDDITEALREELAGVPGRTVTVAEIGGGPPQSGLEVRVTGADYASISAVAEDLAQRFRRLDGVVNVASDVSDAREEIVISVDPARAGALGLTSRAVALQVHQFLVGQEVSQITLDGVVTSVVVRGRPEDIDSVDKLRDIVVSGPLGDASLGEVAEVTFEEAPVSISRSDGRRSASISGSITAEDTQAVGRAVQRAIDATSLPPGVEVTTGGIFQQIAEGFQDIFLAMAVGIVLVYLVMVATLGSLRNPIVIVMSLPLALVGALSALAITGRTLGLPAMMGILLLIGIVVTNAIVLIAFVEQLRERGLSVEEALMEGGRTRLRPILMTAFTTSIALLPLAVFVGAEGGIIGADLATVVIGGLISSSFLTLIVVPVMYTVLHTGIPSAATSLASRVRGRNGPRSLAPGEAAGDDS